MKKALFISHVPPFPAIGGDRLRIARSLRLLTESYEVDIVYITRTPEAPPMRDSLPAIRNERSFWLPDWRRKLLAARTLFNGRSLDENNYRYPAMMRYVKSISAHYDMIFCASPVSAQYAFAADTDTKVLDMIDSLTMNYANAARSSKGWRRLFFSRESRKMRRYEEKCCRAFDSVAYISEVDRDYLPTGENKHIVGNAIRPFNAPLSYHDPADRHLIFVGKMDYEPNIRAVTFFAREVIPMLRKEIPDLRFSIVGIAPTQAVRELSSLPGVEVTGFVESLDPWFERATMVVAPMLSGSGVQNKILEALAHGCAVATTPIGLEGISQLADVLEVIPPEAATWTQKLSRMLRDPGLLTDLATRAPERVEQEFGLPRIRRQFRAFLEPNT